MTDSSTPRLADLETQLLARAAHGDEQAAAQAVCLYDSRLRRVVRLRLDRRVRARVGVDDVLQETHIEAVARMSDFLAKRHVSLFIWLRFLAVQRCVTLARRHLAAAARDARKEQGRAVASPLDSASAALTEALASQATSPSGAAARDEVRASIRIAVDSLAVFDREILCLRHFEELDNAEAAAALDIEPGTASKRYVRSLERLRDVMSAAGFDGPAL